MTPNELSTAWQRFESDRADTDARRVLWSHYVALADKTITLCLINGRAQKRDVCELQGHVYTAIPDMLDGCKPGTDAAFQKYGYKAMSNRVRDWYRKEAKHRGISLDTRLPGGNSVNVGDFLVAPNSNLRINVSSLEKITKGMPLRGQLAIYFRYYLGWSPSRTARITEETPAAVSSTLTRAHEWIKERHDRQFLLDTLLDH